MALIQRWVSDGHKKMQNICYTLGNYYLDVKTHTLLFCPSQEREKLKPKEFQLLCLLLEYKNQVINKNDLLQKIWKNNSAEDSLNNCICSLRKKLSKDALLKIENLKGIGFALRIFEAE